jgi:hypothetical protein
LNIGAYQNGIAFLSFHLAVNQKIGKPQDNALIAQEIQRLLALKRSNSQGLYVLQSDLVSFNCLTKSTALKNS